MTRATLLAASLASLSLAIPAGASAHRLGKDRASSLAHQINHFRTANGRAPLRLSARLSTSARAYSGHLMRSSHFGHGARIQAAGRWRVLGEVLALGRGGGRRGRWALRAWKRSAGHRAILLDGRYRAIGLGRATGRLGGWPATIWTVQVGRR